MKTIKILHLYYDLLNMYGENGNIRSLAKELERQRIEYTIDYKSLDDEINFNDYDFIYLGAGSDECYELAKNDLKKYINEIKEYLNNNKFILATGNALDLFGELNILNFKTKQIDFRIIGEQVYNFKDIDKLVIGFQNRDKVIIQDDERYLFEVVKGTGYDVNYKYEGIHYNNFYGTYLLGPILVRNPYFREYLVKNLLESKQIKYKYLEHDESFKAYQEYLNNFVNEKQLK